MITLTQLTYIVAVAKHRSFAKAAKACFVTQPTLSVQIQKAEEELGVQLFDRERQPVLVTEIGKEIIEQAKATLREAQRIQEVVVSKRRQVEGEFRLGCIPTVAENLVSLFLRDFLKTYPKVYLHISEIQTEDGIQALENDDLDAFIAATPLQQKGLVESMLYHEEFFLYVSRTHRLNQKKNILQEDLRGEDVWLLGEGHCFRNQVEMLCKMRDAKGRGSFALESGSFETLKQLVEMGMGMTLLPALHVYQLPKKKRILYVRPFQKPIPERQISLICRRTVVKKAITDAIGTVIRRNLPSDFLRRESKAILLPPR